MTMTTEQLIAQLKNPDAMKRYSAISELSSFSLPLFEGSDGELKHSIAIKKLRQERILLATEPLIQVLVNDSHLSNRSLAARTLGEYGDPRAIEPLRRCLDDENLRIIGSAVKALGQLADEASIPRILSFLEVSNEKGLRIEAIGALCNLHYLPAQAHFRKMLQDPDYIVRYEAMQGLVKLSRRKGPEIKADLTTFLSDPHEANRHLAQQWLGIIALEEEGKSLW